ncbi:hypothetical protein LEMLEM_LOCUS16139 [Lemmus lemmus]
MASSGRRGPAPSPPPAALAAPAARGAPKPPPQRVCPRPSPQVGAAGARLAGLPSPQGVPVLALCPDPLGTDLSNRVPGGPPGPHPLPPRSLNSCNVCAGESGACCGRWRGPLPGAQSRMLSAEKPLKFGTSSTVNRQERKPETLFVNVLFHFQKTHEDLIPLLVFVLQANQSLAKDMASSAQCPAVANGNHCKPSLNTHGFG